MSVCSECNPEILHLPCCPYVALCRSMLYVSDIHKSSPVALWWDSKMSVMHTSESRRKK